MRVEPLELNFLPNDPLSKITTATIPANTTITTNCNVVFERSYCSRGGICSSTLILIQKMINYRNDLHLKYAIKL